MLSKRCFTSLRSPKISGIAMEARATNRNAAQTGMVKSRGRTMGRLSVSLLGGYRRERTKRRTAPLGRKRKVPGFTFASQLAFVLSLLADDAGPGPGRRIAPC